LNDKISVVKICFKFFDFIDGQNNFDKKSKSVKATRFCIKKAACLLSKGRL